jgi:hypothetical protein
MDRFTPINTDHHIIDVAVDKLNNIVIEQRAVGSYGDMSL